MSNRLGKLTFRKCQRVVSNDLFKHVLDRKWRFSNSVLTIFVAPNDVGFPRMGITVGKRFGKAHLRNRLKRLVRESFRLNQYDIPANMDYIVMYNLRLAKKKDFDLGSLTFDQVNTAFVSLVEKARKKLDLQNEA